MLPVFTFTIRVRANATNNKVGGTAGDPPRLVVAVQAPAVDGKANSAILTARICTEFLSSCQTRKFSSTFKVTCPLKYCIFCEREREIVTLKKI